jgi:hypothetical protein
LIAYSIGNAPVLLSAIRANPSAIGPGQPLSAPEKAGYSAAQSPLYLKVAVPVKYFFNHLQTFDV